MDDEKNRHIAKSSGYGAYIDFPYTTTDSVVEGKNVIVGDLAEYIWLLENRLEEVEGQYGYECECNAQFVECQNENERLKAENERHYCSL